MNHRILEQYPLDMEGIKKVEILGYGGDVFVIAGETSPEFLAEIQGEIRYRLARKGNTLKIIAISPGFLPATGTIRFQVKIPGDLDVKIVGRSAPVRLKGRFSSVTVASTEGDMRLENASGKFILSSSKGDIVMSKVEGQTTASTAKGDILASELIGDHCLASPSGTLTLLNGLGRFRLASEYSLNASEITLTPGSENYFTTGGSLRLTNLFPSGGCMLLASAPKERIRSDLPNFRIIEQGNHLKARAIGSNPSTLHAYSKEEIHITSTSRSSFGETLYASA
ncbi:PF13345 domain protein [Leptospira inadai serovar Lyme str. 10]|uniref:PF13345 domain protein n=2 Tax=Leptospira inadai serovar Lyme TaxID=293084 RepID=V6H9I4_9LEPT|nr:hypothetical protein [Leptospira inadai]EQA34818.1 PF13345 domain protein [Leptospira inadai serovar Lyme str. 10]PNV74150.1 hypothetical protein BES34_014955 [Leptospira inadai serovar Lyme]